MTLVYELKTLPITDRRYHAYHSKIINLRHKKIIATANKTMVRNENFFFNNKFHIKVLKTWFFYILTKSQTYLGVNFTTDWILVWNYLISCVHGRFFSRHNINNLRNNRYWITFPSGTRTWNGTYLLISKIYIWLQCKAKQTIK